MPQWVSPAQLARHLGVSYAAVTTAINKGRLQKSIRQGSNGRYQVHLENALQEWAENTDAIKANNAYGGEPKSAPEIPIAVVTKKHSSVPPFSESRAVKEAYLARLAKLDYEERNHQLVSVDQVKVDAFKLARTVRDALLAIPERISAQLAAEADAHCVNQLLTHELMQALQILASPSE